MRPDIVPGGIFPDYQLPDHTGELQKLSEPTGRESADPHTRARPVLPKGTPTAFQFSVLRSYLINSFVEGHGFSRAVKAINDAGFSP